MIAVGVARPSASGQVMTTTVMANSSAMVSGWSENSAQAAKVAAPPSRATNTSQNAARSASRWPGALEFCACCTSATIWASAVSAPDLGGPDPQGAVGVDGRADDLATRGLVHRQALPGDHGLVDLGLAVLDDAVDRDLRAGADQQQVAG